MSYNENYFKPFTDEEINTLEKGIKSVSSGLVQVNVNEYKSVINFYAYMIEPNFVRSIDPNNEYIISSEVKSGHDCGTYGKIRKKGLIDG